MSAPGCPDDHRLMAYVEQTLSPEERQALDAHLVECLACADIVAEVTRQLFPGDDPDAPAGAAVEAQTKEAVARIGPYELREELGAGAMGLVYRAWDPGLRRDVALKIMRPDLFLTPGGEQLRARFQREAKLLARLNHGNVVSVYDCDESDRGLYIVMEYVSGASLTDWLTQRQPTGSQIVRVFLQIGAGLAAAHDAGLVHRDVKPDNILVGEDNRARIADFGLAVSALDGGVAGASRKKLTRLTQTGALLGTPAYMAPEQLKGEAADSRADQYSFCASLFEAIYGELLQDRERWIDSALGEQRGSRNTRPVPDALRRTLKRGLRQRPEERFGSMQELVASLAAAGHPDAWNVPRRPLWHWAAAALGALTVIALGWMGAHWLSGEPRRAGNTSATTAQPSVDVPPSPRPRSRTTSPPAARRSAVVPPMPVAASMRRPVLARKGVRRPGRTRPFAVRPPPGEPPARAPAPPPARGTPARRTPPPAEVKRPRPMETQGRPTANDKWEALTKRQQAKQAASRRSGAQCLSLLNAADKLDPSGRGRAAMLRSRCEMLAGQCARGRRRFRRLMKSAGYSGNQLQALEDAAARRYCPGGR